MNGAIDDAEFSYASPDDGPFRRILIRAIEHLSGQPHLLHLYQDYQARSEPKPDFWAAAVRALEIEIDIRAGTLENIPSEGPALIVANHPFGVLDGVALAHIVHQRRPDFRLLVHSLLLRASAARPWLLPIDFTDSAAAARANVASRNAARDWLAGGGVVLIFPGATVSTAPRLFEPAIDPDWQPFVAALMTAPGTQTVPIYVDGENSFLFQLVSHFSQTLRLALLFHEVTRRIGKRIDVSIGAPIDFESLKAIGNRREIAAHLRRTTYALGGRLDIPPSERLQEIAGRRTAAAPTAAAEKPRRRFVGY